jgi:periplasmic divalent cation tolerance protein
MAREKLVFMTAPDADSARRIVGELVEQKLVACGNIIPSVTSIYRWDGAVRTATEVMAVLKTTENRVMLVLQRIGELHPYDVPEAIAVDIDSGMPSYLGWIHESTREVDEG